MCQSPTVPSTALYWHIGETTIRLGRVTPRSAMGENNLLVTCKTSGQCLDLRCFRACHVNPLPEGEGGEANAEPGEGFSFPAEPYPPHPPASRVPPSPNGRGKSASRVCAIVHGMRPNFFLPRFSVSRSAALGRIVGIRIEVKSCAAGIFDDLRRRVEGHARPRLF